MSITFKIGTSHQEVMDYAQGLGKKCTKLTLLDSGQWTVEANFGDVLEANQYLCACDQAQMMEQMDNDQEMGPDSDSGAGHSEAG